MNVHPYDKFLSGSAWFIQAKDGLGLILGLL